MVKKNALDYSYSLLASLLDSGLVRGKKNDRSSYSEQEFYITHCHQT